MLRTVNAKFNRHQEIRNQCVELIVTLGLFILYERAIGYLIIMLNVRMKFGPI